VPVDAQPPSEPLPVYRARYFEQDVIQGTRDTIYGSEDIPKRALWLALVGGSDCDGNVIDASCLLTSIPAEKPAKGASDNDQWVWDFINSSTDLKIGSKTLGEYFGWPPVAPVFPRNSSCRVGVDESEQVWIAKSSMAAKIKGRRLLLTQRYGFIALGPMAARQDDMIAILVGHKRPVVIRCIDDDKIPQRWRIIGECYINNLMNGEAVDGSFLSSSIDFLFI
jgi:hypothetical protein